MTADHLPMATGTDKVTAFLLAARCYARMEAIAKDAEGEADRAAERAKDARMRADDAQAEMTRIKYAMTTEEWAEAKSILLEAMTSGATS